MHHDCISRQVHLYKCNIGTNSDKMVEIRLDRLNHSRDKVDKREEQRNNWVVELQSEMSNQIFVYIRREGIR